MVISIKNDTESQGASVAIIEKRSDYKRNTWFDLEPLPRSTSLDYLRSWGFSFQRVEHIVHDSKSDFITVRNQYLERFLAKIVSILNITLIYRLEFIDLCLSPDQNPNRALFHVVRPNPPSAPPNSSQICDPTFLHQTYPDDQFLFLEFDIIIGCDGDSSRVRTVSNIEFPIQDEFQFASHWIRMENLHQSTLIANFKVKNGECPHLKYATDTDLIGPYFPGFVIDGITAIFKRFYQNSCQLQILFTQEIGNLIVQKYQSRKPKDTNDKPFFWSESPRINSSEVADAWQEEAIPWNLLLRVVNLLFVEEYESIQDLQKDIRRRAKEPGIYAFDIFDIVIKQASINTKILQHHKGSRVSIVTLHGDSSVSAHYRYP
jgi:hypothetical protein